MEEGEREGARSGGLKPSPGMARAGGGDRGERGGGGSYLVTVEASQESGQHEVLLHHHDEGPLPSCSSFGLIYHASHLRTSRPLSAYKSIVACQPDDWPCTQRHTQTHTHTEQTLKDAGTPVLNRQVKMMTHHLWTSSCHSRDQPQLTCM